MQHVQCDCRQPIKVSIKYSDKEQQAFGSDTYFPLSAEMYSSQEIVFGDGGMRDCLLAGYTGQRGEQLEHKRAESGSRTDRRRPRCDDDTTEDVK